jgi:signal transduction histidine kinase
MEWYLQDFSSRWSEIDIDFQVVGLKKRLDAETEVALYRIFQECLTNVAKHAGATRVDVTLTHSHPRIILLVVDNGIGYTQAESGLPIWKESQGIGLLSIRERVASLGGVIEMTSSPGRGTRMRIEIPAG